MRKPIFIIATIFLVAGMTTYGIAKYADAMSRPTKIAQVVASAAPVLVSSTATRPAPPPAIAPCDSDMAQTAAIRSLPNGVSSFGNEESRDDVMNDRAKIACLRSWAANQSPCARIAYEFWLDWYDKRIDEAEESIKTHREERRDKVRSAEEMAKEQRLRDYLKASKFPVPHGYRCQ